MIRNIEFIKEHTIQVPEFTEFTIGNIYHIENGKDTNFVGICTEIHETLCRFTPLNVPFTWLPDIIHDQFCFTLDRYAPNVHDYTIDEIIHECEYNAFNNEYRLKAVWGG